MCLLPQLLWLQRPRAGGTFVSGGKSDSRGAAQTVRAAEAVRPLTAWAQAFRNVASTRSAQIQGEKECTLPFTAQKGWEELLLV